MGEYWSVDECRWVRWTPVPEPDEQALSLPQPRDRTEPAEDEVVLRW